MQVANCAQSVEGDAPLVIPSYYPENCWPDALTSAGYLFGTDMYEAAWFMDAGTSDVTRMRLNKRGMAVRGGNNPAVVCCQLSSLLLRCARA